MSPDQVLRHALRLLSTDEGRRLLLEQLDPADREALARQVLTKELLLRLAGEVPWTGKELASLASLAQAAKTNRITNVLGLTVTYERGWTSTTYTPAYVDVTTLTIVQVRELLKWKEGALKGALSERDVHVIRREARRRGLL